MKEFLGYGRSRSSSGKGDIITRHFNDYVNCIHTMVGGGWKTMEVLVAEFDMSEIKYIGQMSSSQNSRVIDPEGISYAVTNGHKDGEPKIIERDTPMKGNYTEPRICTMVGRDPNNPSSRVRSDHYEQFLEMGDDVSNTLTSVQKDNLVAEPNRNTDGCIQVGNIYPDLENMPNRSGGRVYSKEGCSPTILSRDFKTPKLVAEPLRIPQATKQGYIEVPQGAVFDMSYPESTTRRGRVQEGGQVSPILMAGGEAPCYFEGVSVHPNSHALEFKGQESIKQDAAPSLRATDYKAPHCVWETVVGSKQANSFLGDVNGEAPCITSACGAGGGMTPMVTNAPLKEANTEEFREQVRGHRQLQYRIRKLTPRECFRLMGVTETDIDKIQQSGVSQSQQYKMAGNSIVVDCLYHMFRKMFTETACESQQLSLF